MQLKGRTFLSRDRRVSCSAIAGLGITGGRPRDTDCYHAIETAGITQHALKLGGLI